MKRAQDKKLPSITIGGGGDTHQSVTDAALADIRPVWMDRTTVCCQRTRTHHVWGPGRCYHGAGGSRSGRRGTSAACFGPNSSSRGVPTTFPFLPGDTLCSLLPASTLPLPHISSRVAGCARRSCPGVTSSSWCHLCLRPPGSQGMHTSPRRTTSGKWCSLSIFGEEFP